MGGNVDFEVALKWVQERAETTSGYEPYFVLDELRRFARAVLEDGRTPESLIDEQGYDADAFRHNFAVKKRVRS